MEKTTRALAKKVSVDMANPSIQKFLKNIIFPRLPDDLIKDPDEAIEYLQIHNAINHTVGVNFYFLTFIIAYDRVEVNEKMWEKRPSHKAVGEMAYRWEYIKDYDGNFISGVSDFLDYVAEEIGASQRTLWSKVTLIRNLINLDLSREEVYDLFYKGAWTIQQVLNSIGEFRNGRLETVSESTIENYIEMNPEESSEIRKLAKNEDEKSKAFLSKKLKPFVKDTVKSWIELEDSRMIRDWEDEFVNPPETKFKFIPGGIEIKYITYKRDKHGNKVRKNLEVYKMFVANDTGIIPDQLAEILSDNLPIRSRRL